MYRASASDFFRVCQGPRSGLSTARLDSLAYSMSRKEPSGTCKVERGFVPLAHLKNTHWTWCVNSASH